jgi:peptide/nickel transport system ATP-binding protein
MMGALEVENLRVEVAHTGADIVDHVSFVVEAGEILGIVGESGSGKTTVAHALLGHARTGARIAGGRVRIGGEDILTLSPEELRSRRGVVASYVPQDPPAALNPAMRVGMQLGELVQFHDASASEDTKVQRALDALSDVSLPTTDEFLRRFPHQLSGGQQQRVVLAMAFILRPTLVVLDEPTTGLDVTTQAQVLRVVLKLCENHNVAAVYVTHDLAVVSSVTTRSMVMYSGRISEIGPTQKLFAAPAHPYTRRLMRATPDPSMRRPLEAIAGVAARPGQRPRGCFFHPRCDHATARCVQGPIDAVAVDDDHLSWCVRTNELGAMSSPKPTAPWLAADGAQAASLLEIRHLNAYHGHVKVVKDASLQLLERECHALVGQSGSGKTTLARSVIGLHTHLDGEVVYRGEKLPAGVRSRSAAMRRRLQYIFQSPYNSLNPRQAVGDSVALPIKFFFDTGSREARKRAVAALERVGLPPVLSRSYPDELSGGERQRVAIARALVCEPEVLICDEITSALDVSVQAAIIDLLLEMQRQDGLSMLFITHNLALVRNLADRVTILNQGVIVEHGNAQAVLDHPQHEYTRKLLSDSPSMFEAAEAQRPAANGGGSTVPVAGG